MDLDEPSGHALLGDADFVQLLADLGAARLQDERVGGPYWAEFKDWCFGVDEPVSPRALDIWLGERRGVELSPKQVARLRDLVGQA